MKFIDLFSGLGCFHVALHDLGHDCVYACEINKELNTLYEKNFSIKPDFDITKTNVEEIPDHDILCAGFPCQAFSKAGRQLGVNDDRGKLINKVIEVLGVKRPSYFILENVRNLEKHNKGKTWRFIEEEITRLGYKLEKKILSPHQFGIPQHRERIFIIGSLKKLEHYQWPSNMMSDFRRFHAVQDSSKVVSLEKEKEKVLDIWQEFLDILPNDVKPYSPLWSMEFGADYPIENFDVNKIPISELKKLKGSFGRPLKGNTRKELIQGLPNYIKKQKGILPKWKQNYIKNNRKFYIQNKSLIDKVLYKIERLDNESWQKFEWNCGDLYKNIWEYYIQFRGSGIRIKKTEYFPSLVTVSTQIPIVGKEKRYITAEEAKMLQSIPEYINLPDTQASKFKALGNAVNVDLIKLVAGSLLSLEESKSDHLEKYINVL
ncbi:DNA (cytosine-5-)-methyltransferase [Elizabethkingia anophelis]|uniref:DNA (cytosine-5-)-methyltransferase n=1 Tax=Elizabethkingia anophelis TaxID=1117645 RepID=UPI002922689B|nr:MAG: hypothetical protein PQ275_23780 [Elizabethkingia anophelis]